jgi:hypothetical protein
MFGVAAFGELANVYDDTEPQHPQLSSRIVLDGGWERQFAGPSNRSVFTGTVGVSVGF